MKNREWHKAILYLIKSDMRYRVILYLLFFANSCYSQGFKVRHYIPNALTAASRAIFETSPGVYFTGGFVADTVNGQLFNRLTLMGLNSQGQVTWTKKYGRNSFKYANNPFIARSYYRQGSFIYYTGCVIDSNNAQIGVLIKFNASGDTIWQRIFRDTAEDVIPQMVTASVDGGFLITGFFQNWSNNTQPCLLIKTDANGMEIWRKRINKVVPNTSDGKAIIQDSASKKIVIGGYQYIGNASTWSGYNNILILDSLGVKLSQHNIPGVNGVIRDLIQTKDKKIVAVGASFQTVNSNTQSWSSIIKFDLNNPNSLIWSNANFDYLTYKNIFSCIKELDNGDLIIGGSYDTLQTMGIMPQWMTRLVCMSPSGAVKWKRYYNYWSSPGIINSQELVSMELGINGGYMAALYSYNPSPNPFIFIRWDSLGCDTSQAYCQMVALGLSGTFLQGDRASVSPNPCQRKFFISIPGQATESKITLCISDISGREIKQIELNPNLKSHEIDLGNLNNGVYLLRLDSDAKLLFQGKIIKQD